MTGPEQRLEELWGSLPVGEPPLDALLDRGRRARRRRQRVAVLASAAVVAVVAVLGSGSYVALDRLRTPDGPAQTTVTDLDARISRPPLVAPPGTRLVGLGRAAVAVPAEWGTNDVACPEPIADTVLVGSNLGDADYCAVAADPDATAAASWLEIWDTRRETPSHLLEPYGTVDGLEVLAIEPSCHGRGAERCTATLAVPSQHAAFVVSVVGDDAQARVDEVVGSLQVVPAGYDALPLTLPSTPSAAREELRGLGFATRVVEVDTPAAEPGRVVETVPPGGTPVPLGSQVTLRVAAPAR
ncbi:PASTA domain-containing protein [Nocardioides sp. SYSU D00038]|uniref:PASTA domain-containing protein n=1 Tax=Nocardioides sp. SYSU D00038 TaxID=2812554 RepID=UPI001966F347|nr:PASTA domain-containing protein [Nocardioides sp. SYSU D00038]